MAAKTPSRYGRSASPGLTPGRRVTSPTSFSTSSYSPTITGAQKLNVVTRVTIEGKAHRDKDAANIKMYLKMSIPLDQVEPGTTIPLFPEENIKVSLSQVHPLDNNSVPYHFSSAVSPLLNNAARALNLPARSPESFNEAFNLSPSVINASTSTASARSSKGNTSSDAPGVVDERYTGKILVSGYNISYVLPKAFPQSSEPHSRISFGSRRGSVGDRNHVQFMAAIELMVPYVSRPPRAPYLLSIPTPRCLHNNIKLRIFPPRDSLASTASLSDDDAGSWDLTSDPHVSRPTRTSRTTSYNNFADDESSDSSASGLLEGIGIQGTFPSAERIRVRWAKPLKNIANGDSTGRWQVGTREVQGAMICTVKGKMKHPDKEGVEGITMDVEYKGTCKGVWFPGVATLLGMDVGLVSKGSDVSWVTGYPNNWQVTGGTGFTGFDVGTPPSTDDQRHDSFDSNSSHAVLSAMAAKESTKANSASSSTSSLLRAPLPVQNVADYSFEGSASAISSLPSTGASMAGLSASESVPSPPPSQAITLHINMNELPSRNTFTFTITGTILITPKTPGTPSPIPSGDESESDPEPVLLPGFTVFGTDSEVISIIVRNEIDRGSANVEVYNSTGDYRRDAQVRKTVLQKGGHTKCGDGGGRIALRSVAVNGKLPPSRPRTPSNQGHLNNSHSSSPALLMKMLSSMNQTKRNMPVIIPSVTATVTPLVLRESSRLSAYAVRVSLTALADPDSEWLEFGLGSLGQTSSSNRKRLPKVDLACVSVEGVPVKYEATAAAKQEQDGDVPFEQMSGKEWISWVRVHIGSMNGGSVVVDYVVKVDDDGAGKGKGKAREDAQFDVFLPTFAVPIGRLEVIVEDVPGHGITFLDSNLRYRQARRRLLHYSGEEFFYPHLRLILDSSPSNSSPLSSWWKSGLYMCLISLVVSCAFFLPLSSELRRVGQSLDGYSFVPGSHWNDEPRPVIVTTTVYSNTRQWIADESATPEPSSSEDIYYASPTSSITTTTTTITATASEIKIPRPETPPPQATWESTSSSSSQGLQLDYDWASWQTLLAMSWGDLHPLRDKLVESLESLWQIFRKAYHYPLPPP
ncbi:uncharacterized protein BT62DRAFT_966126 [Guyanagaster necrorhizus]|uniref:Uncharacterized protein n=1 Tax=Guyanagaster necrorhizus TaxID=856835 RepID=A0A9P7VWG8_9AGAR|nr:uncharacterized protein BT62DRAFT_966126 [Guyanagaster necrorhizus MCA 3950]KAG7448224.1 hypothetical protein BT62DRAFT_966126 [Guyanagaster necrorhizus MCA 3950]